MKLKIEAGALKKAVAIAEKAVAQKSTLSVLECFVLDIQGKQLVLSSTNLSERVEVRLDCESDQDGLFAVNAQTLSGITKYCDAGEVLTLEKKDDTNVVLLKKQNGMKYKLPVLVADEAMLPAKPKMENPVKFNLPYDKFKNLLETVLFACSASDLDAERNGAAFTMNVTPEKIRTYGLDGYRIASYEEPVLVSLDNEFKIKLRKNFILDLLKIENKENKAVEITISKSDVIVNIRNVSISGKILQGNIFDAEKIKIEGKNKFEVKTADMLEALNSILPVCTKVARPLVVEVTEEGIHFSMQTEMGEADTLLEVKTLSPTTNIRMGMNIMYLLETVKNIQSENFILKIDSEVSPIEIRVNEAEYYIVLPVRIKN